MNMTQELVRVDIPTPNTYDAFEPDQVAYLNANALVELEFGAEADARVVAEYNSSGSSFRYAEDPDIADINPWGYVHANNLGDNPLQPDRTAYYNRLAELEFGPNPGAEAGTYHEGFKGAFRDVNGDIIPAAESELNSSVDNVQTVEVTPEVQPATRLWRRIGKSAVQAIAKIPRNIYNNTVVKVGEYYNPPNDPELRLSRAQRSLSAVAVAVGATLVTYAILRQHSQNLDSPYNP